MTESASTPAEAVSRTLASRESELVVVQDFRPLGESIEWELGQLYYHQRGVSAFLSNDVPYVVHNDGTLSAGAAELFFRHLVECGASEGRIDVLELGPGAGLFGRFFLDHFQALCRENGKDYYERLGYTAGDASARMLADLEANGIFAGHGEHFAPKQVDALQPLGPQLGGAQFHAVFLNYLLDCLPPSALFVKDGVAYQLHVRTCVDRKAGLGAGDRMKLLDLYPMFQLRTEYRPVSSPSAAVEFAARLAQSDKPYVLLNHGAHECLKTCLDYLHTDGFILISDYGASSEPCSALPAHHQHFGGSTAIGVNFPLLRGLLSETCGSQWVSLMEDEGETSLHLAARQVLPSLEESFKQLLGKPARDLLQQPALTARTHLREERHEAAIRAYSEGIRRQSSNWVLYRELAEVLSLSRQEPAAGLEVARAGLRLNPISHELWNVFGDSLFALGEVEQAHQAFLKARELAPRHPRSHYNLVYTHTRKGEFDQALRTIADAFLCDRDGQYRERLLERQAEILDRLAGKRREEADAMANRCPSFAADTV